MSQNEIKRWCRQDYGLHGNQRISNVNLLKYEFTIMIGDCKANIPFSKRLKRQLKIESLLNECYE